MQNRMRKSLLGGQVERHFEDHAAAVRVRGVDTQAAAQFEGGHAADGQPETRSLRKGVEFDEAFENRLLLGGRNARPGIGHGEAHQPFGDQTIVGQDDLALDGELRGVVQQMLENLHDPLRLVCTTGSSVEGSKIIVTPGRTCDRVLETQS